MKHKKSGIHGLKLYLLIILLDLIAGGIWYYTAFPALNIHNRVFWMMLIVFVTADTCLIAFSHLGLYISKHTSGREFLHSIGKDATVVLCVDLLLVAIVLAGSLFGWKLFRAKSYASLLTVEKRDFTEDIKESNSVTNIALMDSESAGIFGNREIGSLSDVVSQYEVAPEYNQINIKGLPMKVSALKYASFFKWFKNRSNGIPGYVEVNPVNSDAQYVKLNSGMKYVPSGYFNDNLQRHVQFAYPTKIIEDYYFEVDNSGKPYYICPCLSAKVGLFNGMDVVGAIICDPISGKCKYYKAKDIPSWVDHVFDGDLCARKYDWHGTLSKGYFNSIISQTGCTKTTDDYGYITIDDDVWIYTGVTSLNNDQSNVGFIMVNERTSEARYYKVSGAEEYSAMKSAEGTVQEKKYEASFPCLINVKGQPTYIMVLKDSGGLVKMYAMVNVEQYNIVATGKTQSEVFANYKKMLSEEAVKKGTKSSSSTDDATPSHTFTIADIQYVQNDDTTMVYIKTTDRHVFKQPFEDNEALITLAIGDTIAIVSSDYETALASGEEEKNDTNTPAIYMIDNFTLVKQEQPATENEKKMTQSTESAGTTVASTEEPAQE